MFVYGASYLRNESPERMEVLAGDDASAAQAVADRLGGKAAVRELEVTKEADAAAAARLLKTLREARHYITGSSHLDEPEMQLQIDEALRAGTVK